VSSTWNALAWRGELFWVVRDVARPFEAYREWPAIADYDALLAKRAGVHFREQPPRPRGARRAVAPRRAYDAVICEEGVVPSRARSWHDFFNALVWAAFPRAKRALHARQHRVVTRGETRTREGDGLALLDEGCAVLLCRPSARAELERALASRALDAVATLARERVYVGAVYGHAVLEHLARDAPPVRALAHVASCERLDDAEACRLAADASLALALADERAFVDPDALHSLPATADLLPLPLGLN
jgi:hypothetical protein